MPIRCSSDDVISVEQAIELYKASSLGEHRPVDWPDIFAGMLANASLTITAWDGDRLVGIRTPDRLHLRGRSGGAC